MLCSFQEHVPGIPSNFCPRRNSLSKTSPLHSSLVKLTGRDQNVVIFKQRVKGRNGHIGLKYRKQKMRISLSNEIVFTFETPKKEKTGNVHLMRISGHPPPLSTSENDEV